MSQTTDIRQILGIAATVTALASCDSSAPVPPDSGLQLLSAQTLADDPEPGVVDNTLTDLTISELIHEQAADGSHRFQISISGNDKSVDLNNLSFMMETSTTNDFQSVYKSALYDQRTVTQEVGVATITARTKAVPLRDASYFTRVVVNPDWHLYLENTLVDNDLSTPLHYIGESNYQNNTSTTFMTTVNQGISCIEDNHENNDTISQATALQSGQSLDASLCDDNADYYAFNVPAGDTTVVSFSYSNKGSDSWKTRYSVIDSDHQRIKTGLLDTAEQDIQITAENTGTHYLAVFGERSNYRLSRDTKTPLAADWFFSDDNVAGPVSPVYGPVTLTRLNFTTTGLINHTAKCSRFVIDPESLDQYITPSHFPDMHTFLFLENNEVRIDNDQQDLWNASTGDISSDSWYNNPYFGWAENTGDGTFRYWDFDGNSYIGCRMK